MGFLIGRYLRDGTLDESFGRGGWVAPELGALPIATAVAIQPDGKIVAAGSDIPPMMVLARYEATGARDRSFGNRGQTSVHVGYRQGGARDLAVQPNGRILVAGYGVDYRYDWTAFLVAYKPNGELDESFSGDGMVKLTAEDDVSIEFDAMEVLPGGKILLAGDLSGYLMVVRLLPNGKPDPTFDHDGQAFLDVDGDKECPCAYASGLALDRRGRAVVAAEVVDGDPQPSALVRYLPNGKLDRGFGRKGIVRTTLGNRLAGKDVVIQRNGKIVLAGTYNVPGSGEARVAVVRYLPDGRLDRSFARNGFFTRDFGVEGVAYSAIVQRDGRVVVGGRANPKPSPFHENESVFDTAQIFLIRFLP